MAHPWKSSIPWATRPIRTTGAAAASSAALRALPAPALFVIGAGSLEALARDRHVIVAPHGYAVVPGMAVHAFAALSLLGRRPVVLGGPLAQAIAVLAGLAANLAVLTLAGALLAGVGRRPSPLATRRGTSCMTAPGPG